MSGMPKVGHPHLGPATGKSFSSLRAVTIAEFRDGKIRRNSDYWDGATAMSQTGVLPAA